MVTETWIQRPINVYDRHDHSRIVLHIDDMPAPPCSLDEDGARVANWIRRVGPIETPMVSEMYSLMTDLLHTNGQALNGARQWLAIDGPPLVGKTQGVVVAALRIRDWLLDHQPDDRREPFDHIPVVIVSGDLGLVALARTLLDKIADYLGTELPRRGGYAAAISSLSRILRDTGTLLVIVDDAHFIKRKTGTRELTDDLKDIITTLPVTFVFVGAGLWHSALLHVPSERITRVGVDPKSDAARKAFARAQYSAVEQLRLRMLYLPVPAYVTDSSGAPSEFIRDISAQLDQFDRIDGFDTRHLRTQMSLNKVFKRSGGRTGRGFTLMARISALAAEMGSSPGKHHVDAVTGMSDKEIDRA